MALVRLVTLGLAVVLVAGCSAAVTDPSASSGHMSPAAPLASAAPKPSNPSPSLRGADGEFAAIEGANLLSRGRRVLDPGVSHDEILALARANTEFGLDVYRLLAAHSDGNIFLGPHSISTALAMIYAGARGATARHMGKALRWDAIENVSERFNALDFALASREQPGTVELNLVNQAFAQPGLPLAEAYLETLSAQFGAPLAELEFSQPERARSVINDWVAEETADRIEELFPPGMITPYTRLVLVNAISLDAAWRFEFDPAATRPERFRVAGGEEIAVPTMHFDLYLPLAWEPDYSAVELMYGRGDLSMVLILPKDAKQFDKNVDLAMLDRIIDRISEQGIHLGLPKFSFKRHVEMDPILKDLGMGIAYSHEADFTGMVEAGDLFLDTVQHEAFIQVDETGTEAHAATGGAMAESHGPTIEFNRPFFFVIRDRITGAILFLGRVTDPSSSE